jgi:hypothetical protein
MGVVRPTGIPIVFFLPLLVPPTFVMERDALDVRRTALELGVEFMKVGLFDELE